MTVRLVRTLALGLALAAGAAASLSEHVVDYRIRAELDVKQKTLIGLQTLVWRNASPDRVSELRFYLYLNAFANEKSSFMRESGGQLRGDMAQKDDWGWIDVRRISVHGGADLTQAIRYVQPDDGNADDHSVMAVTLPVPVESGASISLDIAFVSKLPKVFARTGYHDDFFMVAQWFPKIGVWEKAGDRYAKAGGWNCHQFHANTEFYADYGVYDVAITAPVNYVVGATGGIPVETSVVGGKKTSRFHQEDVHDFAWTASPRYLRVEREFDPARVVTPRDMAATEKLLGMTVRELALKPVRMILLIQPEHKNQIDRQFRALENGLKWFGLWYGAYPYSAITLVDPPFGANGAGGMEYPTLITGGTSLWPGANDGSPEEVIVHEFGHQYWYGMVGTNEFEESWLDEGFNTYSTGKVMDVAYGERDFPLHLLGVPVGHMLGLPKLTSDIFSRSLYLQYGKFDPVVRNGWQYYDSLRYGVNSYMRPGALLRTLENHLGAGTMARIMRTWFARGSFHHPTSHDFLRVVNEVSGRDCGWFFDDYVFGTNRLNYKVASVSSEEEGVKLGTYSENGKRITISEDDAERLSKGKPKRYHVTVRLMREGEAYFPVEMKLTLENGEVIRERWDGRERWIKYEYAGRAARAASVAIDPDNKVLLDMNRADNSWVEKPPATLAKWASNVLFWMQMVLP